MNKIEILCKGDIIKKIEVQCTIVPTGNYMFNINNKNTRKRCEKSSKLTITTPQRRHWRCSGDFIVSFEHTLHHVLVILFLSLSI